MPYKTNSELPKAVKEKLTDHQQSIFRNVFNAMMGQKGMIESRAFAGAWAQAKRGPETKPTKKTLQVDVVKFDNEQQLVYGWAYVTKENGEVVYDHSGEWMKSSTLEKAATEFMLTHRIGKTMHSGEKVSDVVHSLPLTDELAKSLGIQSNREGWILAMKVNDPIVWKAVKSGALPAFSIGGRAVKVSNND